MQAVVDGSLRGRPVVRVAVVPLLVATTAAACAYVFGISLHVHPPPEFAVVPFTVAPVAAIAAAALLRLRARSERDRALQWAAGGLVVACVALLLQLLSLPSVAPAGGIFGPDTQGSPLLYYGFHFSLALGVVLGAVQAPHRWLPWFVLAGIAVSVLAAQPSLTPDRLLLRPDGTFSTLASAIKLGLALMTVVAIALWVRLSGRRPSATRAWLVAALALSLYELLLNTAAQRRYSGLWWSSLSLCAMTYAVLLGGLLWAVSRQLAVVEGRGTGEEQGGAGPVQTWAEATQRLLTAAEKLSEALTPGEVGTALATKFRHLTGLSDVAVYALGPTPADPPGALVPLTPSPPRLERLRRALAPALATGRRPLFAQTRAEVSVALPGFGPDPPGAVAALPMTIGGQLAGIVVVESAQPHTFAQLERELLIAVARQGAQALQRARAVADMQRLTADLRAQVQTLVGTAPDAIVTVDPAGQVLAVNGHASRLFGYRPDELIGQPVDILLPERLREVHRAHRAQYSAAPGMRPMGTGLALIARCSDGTEFPVEVSLAPMPTDGRQVVLATVRDMTSARLAERNLQAAVRRFSAAFNAAPVGMALVGTDGVLLQANQALAVMLDYTSSELAGRSLRDLTDPRDLDEAGPLIADLMAGPSHSLAQEQRLINREGEPVWAQLSCALVRDDEDEANEPYLVVHVEDLRDRKNYEGRLQYLADHDPLTGLYNRRRFDQELTRHLAAHARYGGRGALLLLDLDNFKYVNDSLGHNVGDALIRTVAHALQARLRDTDVLARLGGDEFAVLLPEADAVEADRVAHALLDAVRADGNVTQGAQRTRTTVSIGVMPLPEGPTRPEALVAAADLAMYAAKEEGRDRAVLYDPAGPHQARSEARFRWLGRIHAALEEGLFAVETQPILDLGSNEVTHVELLLRMREGEQLVPPGLFLYIAERHGLARAIDRWVIEQALDLASSGELPERTRLEVNLSADSLSDVQLPALIAAGITAKGIDPSRLVFEVTETAAITNMDLARRFVDELADLGCAFALDDFGAGFGSFYYLKYLPFDYLKIDGEFIRHLPTSRVDQQIVAAIVAAAHGLGKKVIAEYVTDADTVDLLKAYAVDYAQGYYIGPPGPTGMPATPRPRRQDSDAQAHP